MYQREDKRPLKTQKQQINFKTMANDNPIKYSDLIQPDNSISELIKQLDDLSATYTKALQKIKDEAIQLTQSLKGVSGATEEGRATTRKASEEVDRMSKAQTNLANAQSENAKELERLRQATREQNQITKLTIKMQNSAEGSYNRLSAQYGLMKIRLNAMSKAERESTAEGRKLEAESKKIYEEMKRLQEATGKYQLNVGNYTNALKQALGVNNQFGESLLALGRGGEESKKAFIAMKDGAIALNKTLLGMLTNPAFLAIAGIAGMGVAFKWWYDYNAGIAEATRLTREFLGVTGEELEQVRSEIESIADTFGKDYKEVLQTVDALTAQYGITAQNALKIIEGGFQAGADVSGNFLANIQQYAPTFHDAGISASELVAILTQTRSGIFSDKGLQVIEMASKHLREMSTSTAQALDAIGISSQKVAEDLKNGTMSTFDVIQLISTQLKTLPQDSQEVGAVLKDVFGRQGAGAGIQLIEQLGTMTTRLEDVKRITGEYGESIEEVRKSNERLNKALADLFDSSENGFEVMTNQGKVFINSVLIGILNVLTKIKNFIGDVYDLASRVPGMFEAWAKGITNVFPPLQNIYTLVKAISSIGADEKGMSRAEQMIGRRKKIGSWVCEWDGTKWVGIERVTKETKTTTTTTTTTTTATGTKGSASKGSSASDAYSANLQATRRMQDAMLQLEKDEWEKRRKQTEYQYKRQIEDLRHQLATDKNLNISGRNAINETIKALEQKQTEDLLRIEQERQIRELELQKQSIELRLKAVKEGSQEEIRLRNELLDMQEQLTMRQNAMKPSGEQATTLDIQASFEAQRGKLADQYIQQQMQIFDAQQDLAQSEFDLLRNSEDKKTRFRLQAERERLQKILQLNEQASTKLTDVEVETIKNTIAKINQEIEQSRKDERSRDIYGMLGLNLDDKQKEAINTSVNFAIEQLNAYMQAEVDAANAAVENANKKVDSAQRALDAELQARANGYASNVALAQKELENSKKNQEKALKEQQKAQKAQQAIQTVEQIGNLVTSTSLIWSQLGFPWAIPAIAVMWGSFAAAKIKAAQVTKAQTETYGEGTIELLSGGSHQSTNDVDLGTKPDGTRRRAEGGEFFAVINKRNSRKYRKVIPDVIRSFNNGTFANKYLSAFDGANEAINLNVNADTPDIRELNDNVRAIKEQNQRRMYMDGNGNTIQEYKNLKRTILQ